MVNKKVSTTGVVIWLLIVLICIAILVTIIADKKEEKIRLEEYKRRLEKDEAEILALKERNEKLFNITYRILKLIFGIVILTIVGITIHFTESNSFFDYAKNCSTVFGSIGMISIIACLFLEQNPLDIFKAREFFKKFIYELIHDPHWETINMLPQIQEEKKKVVENITKLDSEISQLNFLEIT